MIVVAINMRKFLWSVVSSMSQQIMNSLHQLPIYLTYRILDELDDLTILSSVYNTCQRLNQIVDNYQPYQVCFDSLYYVLINDRLFFFLSQEITQIILLWKTIDPANFRNLLYTLQSNQVSSIISIRKSILYWYIACENTEITSVWNKKTRSAISFVGNWKE